MIIGIIDDDSIYQFITRRMISKISENHKVLQFSDGQEAMDFINDNQYDTQKLPELIFLDINMPRLNGWQFLECLQDLNLETYKPQIFMSSSSTDQDDITKASSFKAIRAYLTKPFSHLVLAEILKQNEIPRLQNFMAKFPKYDFPWLGNHPAHAGIHSYR